MAAWGGDGARLRHWGLSEGGERLGSREQKFRQNPVGEEELWKEVVESAAEDGAGAGVPGDTKVEAQRIWGCARSRRAVIEGEGAAGWEFVCRAGGGGKRVSGDHLYPHPSLFSGCLAVLMKDSKAPSSKQTKPSEQYVVYRARVCSV